MNKIPVDITAVDLTFVYSSPSGKKEIDGTPITALEGKVRFTPTLTDFEDAGTFKYEVKGTSGGIVTTYLSSQLVISAKIA